MSAYQMASCSTFEPQSCQAYFAAEADVKEASASLYPSAHSPILIPVWLQAFSTFWHSPPHHDAAVLADLLERPLDR